MQSLRTKGYIYLVVLGLLIKVYSRICVITGAQKADSGYPTIFLEATPLYDVFYKFFIYWKFLGFSKNTLASKTLLWGDRDKEVSRAVSFVTSYLPILSTIAVYFSYLHLVISNYIRIDEQIAHWILAGMGLIVTGVVILLQAYKKNFSEQETIV